MALSDDYLKKAKIVVNIDHHATNDNFGDINIVETVAATGEIIVDIFEAFGYEIDDEIAKCLYVAISTDTGHFMYSNTTKNTFKKVAKLFEKDFEFVDITRKLFLEKNLAQTKLAGIAINGIQRQQKTNILYYAISEQVSSYLIK